MIDAAKFYGQDQPSRFERAEIGAEPHGEDASVRRRNDLAERMAAAGPNGFVAIDYDQFDDAREIAAGLVAKQADNRFRAALDAFCDEVGNNRPAEDNYAVARSALVRLIGCVQAAADAAPFDNAR